ncbi:MAG: amino acid/amide transporter ATP-binding protein 2, family [Frankiales bacterium]|nr:amino acid/amide transporter ATP-binding protein 2, family [Frankiales bacterium]
MTIDALELIDLRAGYGSIEVLHGVSLRVPPATVVALLGPNGAGKSTLLKVASGTVKPTAGCLHVGGVHVNGAAASDLAHAGVCRIPEGRGIFPNLTVAENLQMWTGVGRLRAGEVAERTFTRFPRLGERRKQLAGTLSGGEQQMLAMSRALLVDPAVLLLDEISMGLAPLVVADLYELVHSVAAEGIAILVVEQFARTALAVADHAAILIQGRITRAGTPAEVEEHLSEAYLGGAA